MTTLYDLAGLNTENRSYTPNALPQVDASSIPSVSPQSLLEDKTAGQRPNLGALVLALIGNNSHTSRNDVSAGQGGGSDPWNADPNGFNPVTRHGFTLDQEAMRSLINAKQAGYNPFPYIGNAYRSIAESNALHNSRYDSNGNLIPGNLPAAPGGSSMHNYGLAFDAGNLPSDVARYLEQNGWFNGASFGDPVHYSYYRKG